MKNRTRNILIIIAIVLLYCLISFVTKNRKRSIYDDATIVAAIESRLKEYSNEKFGIEVQYPYYVYFTDSLETEDGLFLILGNYKEKEDALQIAVYNSPFRTPEMCNKSIKESFEDTFSLTEISPISACVFNGEKGCSSDYYYEYVDEDTGEEDKGYMRIITINKGKKSVGVVKASNVQSKLDSCFNRVMENLVIY